MHPSREDYGRLIEDPNPIRVGDYWHVPGQKGQYKVIGSRDGHIVTEFHDDAPAIEVLWSRTRFLEVCEINPGGTMVPTDPFAPGGVADQIAANMAEIGSAIDKHAAHAWKLHAASLAADMLSELGYAFDGQCWTPGTSVVPSLTKPVPGYELLADVLDRAYHQAASGKGSERHAEGNEPFDEQVMQDMARRFGVGSLLGQAFKKSHESQRLPLDRGVRELLGAINYLAGAVIRREMDEGSAA